MMLEFAEIIAKGAASHHFGPFHSHANVSFGCVGGDSSLLGTSDNPTPDSWDKWLLSVRERPAPCTAETSRHAGIYGRKLGAIADFIPDVARRAVMKSALRDYMNKTKATAEAQIFQETGRRRRIKSQEQQRTSRRKASKRKPAAAPNASSSASVDAPAIWMVPGVCNGAGNVGVGCGYDVTQLEVFGLTINPKKPVIQMPACKLKCYLDPALSTSDPDCEYCAFQPSLGDNKRWYRVPDNVLVTEATQYGGCSESSENMEMDSYDFDVSQHYSHSSGFLIRHHHSKTIRDFYHQFFESDSSLSLDERYFIRHAVTLQDLPAPEPTWEFKLAAALLPLKYEGNEEAYTQFVQDFGTHYMKSAQMGALALQTAYFHSCMKTQFGGEFVSESSSSSFIGIVDWGGGGGRGYNKSNELFYNYSEVTVKLLGGDATRHGQLDPKHPLSGPDVKSWLASIDGMAMVPVNFELAPITSLLKNPITRANLNRSINAYASVVGEQMQSLANDLVPLDHYKSPPWCKFDPSEWKPKYTPGASSTLSSSSLSRTAAGAPPCPPLPTPPGSQWKKKHRQHGRKLLALGIDDVTTRSNNVTNECNPAKTCNVCASCCQSYIPDGKQCSAHVFVLYGSFYMCF